MISKGSPPPPPSTLPPTSLLISPLEFPNTSSSNFHSCPLQFSWGLEQMETGWRSAVNESFLMGGGGCGVISAAKPLRHLFRGADLRPCGSTAPQKNLENKRISDTHYGKKFKKKSHWLHARGRMRDGLRCKNVPLFPQWRPHNGAPGQFSALLLKWSPIQFYVGHL